MFLILRSTISRVLLAKWMEERLRVHLLHSTPGAEVFARMEWEREQDELIKLIKPLPAPLFMTVGGRSALEEKCVGQTKEN